MSRWRVIVAEQPARKGGDERDVLYWSDFRRLGLLRKLVVIMEVLGAFVACIFVPVVLGKLGLLIGDLFSGYEVTIKVVACGLVVLLSACFGALALYGTVRDARYRVAHLEDVCILAGLSIGIYFVLVLLLESISG